MLINVARRYVKSFVRGLVFLVRTTLIFHTLRMLTSNSNDILFPDTKYTKMLLYQYKGLILL